MKKLITIITVAGLAMSSATRAAASPDGGFGRLAVELGFVTKTPNNKTNLTYGVNFDGGYSLRDVELGGGVGMQVANTTKLSDVDCTIAGKSTTFRTLCSRTYSKIYVPLVLGAAYRFEIGNVVRVIPGIYGGVFLVNESITREVTGDIQQIGVEYTGKEESSNTIGYWLIMPRLSVSFALGNNGEVDIGGRVYIVPNGPEKTSASDKSSFVYGSAALGFRFLF